MKNHTPTPPNPESLAEDRAEKQQWPIGDLEDPVHPGNPEHEPEDNIQKEIPPSETPEKKGDEWPSVSWP